MDQIAASVSISRFVLCTGHRARADQAHSSLPGSYRPIFERSCDFHYRRIAEARFGGEAIQPHARKVDAHSHLREVV